MDAFTVKASTKASTENMAGFSDRLKVARAALGLKQTEMAAQYGVSARGYQGYEDGRSIPGGEAIAGVVRAGINANWLLTGEGPMLLADLVVPDAPRINVDVLASIIEGLLRTAPNVSPDKLASACVTLYQGLIDKEMITPEGVGSGNQANAA